MGRRLISIVVSLIFIYGGLSGKLVLRGTNSSMALVAVGAIWLIYSIYKLSKEIKERGLVEQHDDLKVKRKERAEAFLKQQDAMLMVPCEITIQNAAGKVLYINNLSVDNIFDESRSFITNQRYNLLQAEDSSEEYDFKFEANDGEKIVIRRISDEKWELPSR